MEKFVEEASVDIICGGLGGGKTARAVQIALDDYLPKGAILYTNILMVPDKVAEYIKERHNLVFQPSQIVDLGDDISHFATHLKRGVDGCPNLLIYDESQLDFTALGYKENRSRMKVELELIAQARKLDVQIIFISQDERDVDVYIRRRSQTITDSLNFQKQVYIGWLFKLLRLPLHRYATYELKRGEVPKNSKPKLTYWHRDLRVCKCYKTKALFGRFKGMEADHKKLEKADKSESKNSTKRRVMQFIVIAIILGLGTLLYTKCSAEDEQPGQTKTQPIERDKYDIPELTRDEPGQEKNESTEPFGEVYRYKSLHSVTWPDGWTNVTVKFENGMILDETTVIRIDRNRVVYTETHTFYPPEYSPLPVLVAGVDYESEDLPTVPDSDDT